MHLSRWQGQKTLLKIISGLRRSLSKIRRVNKLLLTSIRYLPRIGNTPHHWHHCTVSSLHGDQRAPRVVRTFPGYLRGPTGYILGVKTSQILVNDSINKLNTPSATMGDFSLSHNLNMASSDVKTWRCVPIPSVKKLIHNDILLECRMEPAASK